MIGRLESAARLLTAAAVLLCSAADTRASIVAPPDPDVAASLFVEACWQGLRTRHVFRRAVRRSSLQFRRVDDAAPGERYGGRRTHIDYLPNARCTIGLSLVSVEAAEDVIDRVARLTALQVSAVPAGRTEQMRMYRWADLPVSGGRAGIEAAFAPPAPARRFRMYPEAFTLSISAYFTPNE